MLSNTGKTLPSSNPQSIRANGVSGVTQSSTIVAPSSDRYAVTQQQSGVIKLRYSPVDPREIRPPKSTSLK